MRRLDCLDPPPRRRWRCNSRRLRKLLLAREACGVPKASYKPEGSRANLMTQEHFRSAFEKQKARLREMDIRVVEEADPNRQALLEMYVSLTLGTLYNDFANH